MEGRDFYLWAGVPIKKTSHCISLRLKRFQHSWNNHPLLSPAEVLNGSSWSWADPGFQKRGGGGGVVKEGEGAGGSTPPAQLGGAL